MHMNQNLTPSKHNGTDVAKNEHTMNIRTGLVLKTMYAYGRRYDYIDIIRNIKHFDYRIYYYRRSFWKKSSIILTP
jgi:hypothetical protein